MDREKFLVLIKALKSAYTRDNFLPDDKAIQLWYAMLKDIPYEVLNIAIQRHIMTSPFQPTIADLRILSAEIVNGESADWTKAWGHVVEVVSTYGLANGVEGVSKLTEEEREAVKRVGYWAICTSENIGVERANFRAAYETIVASRKKELATSPRLMGEIAQKKFIKSEN